MTSSEKFCLKWNDFQENIANSFHGLREDLDFSDVTLVCEENNQIEAHRVILSACSPFLSSMLKRNKHAHPMIYMRGLNSKDLVAIVDFMYHGEANIYQDDLDGFLALADELQLKGLTGSNNENIEKQVQQNAPTKIETGSNDKSINKEEINIKNKINTNPQNETVNKKQIVTDRYDNLESFDMPVEMTDGNIMVTIEPAKTMVSFDSSIEDLQHTITSMMEKISEGGMNWRCKVCGKTTKGSPTQMKRHVESHLAGMSHPCNLCGKVSRYSKGLLNHVSMYHII